MRGKRIGRVELDLEAVEALAAEGDWERLAPLVTLLDDARDSEDAATVAYTIDVMAWRP